MCICNRHRQRVNIDNHNDNFDRIQIDFLASCKIFLFPDHGMFKSSKFLQYVDIIICVILSDLRVILIVIPCQVKQ